jgi:putative transposase
MSNYRRLYIPGGTIFFTVVTHMRRPFLTDEMARSCLHEAIEKVQVRHPFQIRAIVLLPDHLHTLWTLPECDADYSARWKRLKEEFTRRFLQAGGKEGIRSPSRLRRKERGIWQRRYWEHAIQDETDLERHFDYIHYNPVKHGLVKSPRDWPWSSFHRWVREGIYTDDWGCVQNGPLRFDDLDESAME